MRNSGITSFNLVFISVVLFFYILYIGASFIIPFVIALLISLAITSLSSFFIKKGVNNIISFLLSLIIFTLFFFTIGYIINSNIQEMISNSGEYQARLREIIFPLFEYFSLFEIDVEQMKEKILSAIDISSALGFIVLAVTSVISYLGIIFFYVIFLLLESRFISGKLKIILSHVKGKDKVTEIIDHIKRDVRSYFVIKAVISFITAFLTYIVLLNFGVDFALFWALLVFILNFIPTIGSMIAVLFPLFFAFIQFGFIFSFFAVMVLLISVQVLMGNFIEPRFMGNKLNLSPLVIIISLGFWGIIWGIVGMLLSVPIMVIINIILSNINATKPIAVFMSEKGEIKTDFGVIHKHKKKLLSSLKKRIFKKKKK